MYLRFNYSNIHGPNENKNSLLVNGVGINTEKTENPRKSTYHMLLTKIEGKCS